jgi:hypothetical protein
LNKTLDFPVTVYDVEDKKPVMVFSKLGVCSVYVYDQPRSSYQDLGDYLLNKRKMKKNRFGRVICFRKSSNEHIKSLGENEMVILDERYNIGCISKLKSGYHSTRIEMYNEHCRIIHGKEPVLLTTNYFK